MKENGEVKDDSNQIPFLRVISDFGQKDVGALLFITGFPVAILPHGS